MPGRIPTLRCRLSPQALAVCTLPYTAEGHRGALTASQLRPSPRRVKVRVYCALPAP
jgi:hypothetical protein